MPVIFVSVTMRFVHKFNTYVRNLVLLMGLMHSASHAATLPRSRPAPEVCKHVTQSSTTRSIILDAKGARVTGDIELGNIDSFTAQRDADFFFSNASFRLIVAPARVKVIDLCDMVVCTLAKAVTPRCPGTSEYLINFSLIPSKLGPGVFSVNPQLRLDDPKAEYDEGLDALSGRNIKGTVSMPWLALRTTPSDTKAIENFAAGLSTELVLHVQNIGDRPVQLGNWVTDDVKADVGLGIKVSSCRHTPLTPGASCSVTLERSSGKLRSPTFASWVTFSSDEKYTFSLYARSKNSKSPSVELRNR